MPKTLLEELWIITRTGIPVYTTRVESAEKFDESLFGGFISAILTFIEELGEKDLRKMEMGGTRLVILGSQDKEWFFIGRSNNKIKEKKVHQYLIEVREIFLSKCTFLNNWDNNTDAFLMLDEFIDINNSTTPSVQKAQEEQKARGGFL